MPYVADSLTKYLAESRKPLSNLTEVSFGDPFPTKKRWTDFGQTTKMRYPISARHSARASAQSMTNARMLLNARILWAIQVNLDTGVANGVIVARDVETCAKLI